MDEEFEIPVDNAIREFDAHLQSHPRTILSAKFGDGKSYFINKLQQDKEFCKKYKIIKLYPVNYQISNNNDIIELIKHDILIQLALNEMLPNMDMPEQITLQFFLMNNQFNLLENLVSLASTMGHENTVISLAWSVVKASKLYLSFKKRYDDFKNEYDKNKLLLDYIKIIENESVFDSDPITNIIRTCITEYKQQHNKQVVLFIEDMDRIDPAHIFRILNVLSAHMDYCYRCGTIPDNKSLLDNKFLVDNIVLVLDYNNLKSIFSHFYGNDTDFEGYICKFSDKGFFKFSLGEITYSHLIDLIVKETRLPIDIIKIIITTDILRKESIRKIASATKKTSSQIINSPKLEHNSQFYDIHDGLLRLMIFLRRVGIEDVKIIEYMQKPLESDGVIEIYIKYLLGYFYIKESNENCQFVIRNPSYRGLLQYCLDAIMKNGTIRYVAYMPTVDANAYSVNNLLVWMLTQISQ